jgi:hypothetical protein
VLKGIKIFISTQKTFFSLLFLFFVLPLGLFFHYSSYPLPYVQYVILGYLVIFQYAFFNEKNYRNKVEEKAKRQLGNELGRTPSKSEIVVRVSFFVDCRFVSVFLNSLFIVILMVFYRQY